MLPDYFSEGNDSQDTSDPYSAAMNVPSWLLLIMRAPTVKRLIQRFHTSKGAMLNLDKADDHYPPEKQHIEVRPHTGSIDYAEVSAWVNLIISLLETCSSRVSPDELCTYLTASWKDPKYTLVDLASYVGASQSTQDFYGNMLSREYARRRYDAQMAKVSRDFPLHRFIRAVEGKRRKLIDRSAIDERIRCKFLNGLYGRAPRALLCHFLGTDQIDQASAPLLMEDETNTDQASRSAEASRDASVQGDPSEVS